MTPKDTKATRIAVLSAAAISLGPLPAIKLAGAPRPGTSHKRDRRKYRNVI